MKTRQKGFTLIEVTIVVTIIGILAAIALPAYQEYTIREKVTEGLSLGDATKLAIADTFAATGRFPATNASAFLPVATAISSRYVVSVTVTGTGATQGVVTILYSGLMGGNPTMNGATITLTGTYKGGSISWTCANSSPTLNKYVPAECRT